MGDVANWRWGTWEEECVGGGTVEDKPSVTVAPDSMDGLTGNPINIVLVFFLRVGREDSGV